MSAVFKNAKKRHSQSELRKFMNEHKGKLVKEVKKVDSPLAKYNEQGQLTCILCKSVVRSDAVWPIHINSKQHKQNVDLAKQLKEKTNNFTKPVKRASSPTQENEVQGKKLKGILKNAGEVRGVPSTSDIPEDFFDNHKKRKLPSKKKLAAIAASNETRIATTEEDPQENLPEGFFDDPKQDAKARNQEYKDPAEEEWDKFMKAIKEADSQSAAIIAEDQDEATNERQIDEIDEQMNKLSRVLALERKKVEVIAVSSEVQAMETNENEEDFEEDNFDEYLDWRAKKSFK